VTATAATGEHIFEIVGDGEPSADAIAALARLLLALAESGGQEPDKEQDAEDFHRNEIDGIGIDERATSASQTHRPRPEGEPYDEAEAEGWQAALVSRESAEEASRHAKAEITGEELERPDAATGLERDAIAHLESKASRR
jgi:hypothetical protein